MPLSSLNKRKVLAVVNIARLMLNFVLTQLTSDSTRKSSLHALSMPQRSLNPSTGASNFLSGVVGLMMYM